MKDNRDLLDQSAEHLKKAEALQEKADAENRELTEAEQKEFDTSVSESKRLRASYLRRIALDQQKAKVNNGSKDLLAGKESVAVLEDDDPDVIAGDDGDALIRVPKLKIPATARDKKREGMCGFHHIGEFGAAVHNFYTKSVADGRLAIMADMQQARPADGGFLVPPTFSQQIWDGLNQLPNSLLSMTDRYTVEGESLTFPANAETSRATGSRYGGIQGYWKAEGATMTASSPTVREIRIEPQELYVFAKVTDKLLRNAPLALERFLTRAAIDEINFLVGNAIVNGTGAGQPRGITNSACLISIAKETGQAADTIVRENIAKMWARLHARSRLSAVWLCNQDIQPQLDLMFHSVKNVAQTENVGGFADRLYNPETNTLKGRPVIPVEYCETLGDKGDIILADLSAYVTGTRGGIDSAMSMHLYFDQAKTAFRFQFEADGQCWLASALTPFKGSATLSTFVTLDARA